MTIADFDELWALIEARLNTIDADIAIIQADLDDPDQYKADVSALALEATLTAIKGGGWSTETMRSIAESIDSLNDLTAAEVWAYEKRTITNVAAGIDYPATGDPLEIYRDTSVRITIAGIDDVTGNTNVWFTAKVSIEDKDDDAILHIDRLTGLIRINGQAAESAAHGEMSFNPGTCDIRLAPIASQKLPIYSAYNLEWDLKMLKNNNVTILAHGKIFIYGTPTRRIS